MLRVQLDTGCEGPLALNDNAFELCRDFIKPQGDRFFQQVRRYDDYLAAVAKKQVEEQEMDLATARDAIVMRDFGKLASVAEHNCLKMHSVMWASRPPVVYWNAATLACLERVRELQAQGVGAFFTIDAGPQVKVVCLPADESRVVDAVSTIDGVEAVLSSGIGMGAALVNGN